MFRVAGDFGQTFSGHSHVAQSKIEFVYALRYKKLFKYISDSMGQIGVFDGVERS